MGEEDDSSLVQNKPITSTDTVKYEIDFNKNNIKDFLFLEKKGTVNTLRATLDNNVLLNKNLECDFIVIETVTKYNQAFNLVLGFVNQYHKTEKKIVLPVFFRNNNLYIQNAFITTLGISAKSGNEEWSRTEIELNIDLKNLNLEQITTN